MPFRYFTANGSVKGGRQERPPRVGEGNGQPHASIPTVLEGEGDCAPHSPRPRGVQSPEALGGRGGGDLWAEGGGDCVGEGLEASPREPGGPRPLPAARSAPCAFVWRRRSRGHMAPSGVRFELLSRLRSRGHGLRSLPHRPLCAAGRTEHVLTPGRARACGERKAGPGWLQGGGRWRGPERGREAGDRRDATAPGSQVSPGWRPPPPSPPPPEQFAPCAAGEGAERREELLFQVTEELWPPG